MSFYAVILYNDAGEKILEKNFEDYRQAHEFIFRQQFDNEAAAAGKLLIVTELKGIRCLEKLLEMGMWRPVEDLALQQEYLEYRKG